MHILAMIVAALGGIAFVLWRMQQAANAARDIADAANDMGGLVRRWRWSRKANTNPLDLVDDPREAAAAMMVAVAQADGPLTEAERTRILAEMADKFGASSSHAEELLARARWLTRDSLDAGNVMRRLQGPILKSLGPTERRELVAMLEAVAVADGRPDATVNRDIARLAENLKL